MSDARLGYGAHASPAIEGLRGGERIDATAAPDALAPAGGVTPVIQEHVRERTTHLRRRAEDVRVVAVGEDLSMPAHHAVSFGAIVLGSFTLDRPELRLAKRQRVLSLEDEQWMNPATAAA